MKKLLFACVLIAPAVQAQVIDCPPRYPLTETVLTEVPPQHKGKGLLSQQRLTSAGMTIGQFNGGGDLHGDRRDLKDGYQIDFGVPPVGAKWFVCNYGPNQAVSWWERLDDKEIACKLKVVKKNPEGMMAATLSCKAP